MEQVIIGGRLDNLDDTITEYNGLAGGRSWNATEAAREQLVGASGKLKNLRVELNDAPGAGTSYVFTVRVNGADSELTCAIVSAATSKSDTTHEATVSPGDRVCLECDPVNTPAARQARWTIMFESDTAKESLILGGSINPLNNAATEYNQVTASDDFEWGAEIRAKQVCPTSGKIKNFYVKLSEDPGTSPDAYRFTLRVNGADSDLVVTITADDTTGNDTTDEVTVAAGDILTLMSEPLEGPSAAPWAVWGMAFVADTDGESIILAGTYNDPDPESTEFHYLSGGWADWAAEASRYQLGQACTLKKLYIELQNTPVASRFTFTVRINGADGNLTVDVGFGSKTGSDTTHTDVISDFDELAFEETPLATPVTGDVYWGLVCYIEPPAPPPEKKHTFRLDPRPHHRMRFDPNLKLG